MPDQQGTPKRALMTEHYTPADVTIESPNPSRSGPIRLWQFIGPLNNDTFIKAHVAELSPDTAIQMGEYLASEGRKAKTGLLVANASQIPE